MALALGAAVWWLSPAQGPTALLMTAVLAAGPLYLISRSRSADKEFLLQIFIAALLARLGVGTLIYVSNGQGFFGGDAYQYDYFGNELLMVWRGWNLRTAAAVTGEVSGYGMLYIVAAIYAVVGRNMLAVQYFNAVLGACTVPLLYLCTLHIYGSARVARVAAFFVAFFPSLVLWSAQGLKDGPIVFLLVVTMLMTLRVGEKLRAGYALGLAASLLCLLTFRFYIFYMVAAAAGGALLIGMRKVSTRALAQQLAVLLGVGLMLTYFGVIRTAQEHFDTYGTLEKVQQTREYFAKSAKSGFGEDLDVSTAEGALTAIPLGMLYLLFAPFPWQLGSLRQTITLPEMVVWWASFPLLCLGVWFTLRHRLRQALPIIIFTAMLTLAYSIFQGNVGTAYRQRSQLLVFYFIFVA
ncbi:MAG TPA: glycosyltransferase family 39 protein, partial [Pyrinomonadaceae bacterium]